MRLFVFGLGYSARAVVERMRPRLEAAWGTTRDAGKFGEIEGLGVTPLLFDGGKRHSSSPAVHSQAEPLRYTASLVPPPFTGEGDHAQHGGGGDHERRSEPSPPPPAPKSGVPDFATPSCATREHPSCVAVPLPRCAGEEPVGAKPGEFAKALVQADHVLVSIAPDPSGDPVLNHFRSELAALKPKSIVYLSTIGVYGDHSGDWVDEASECRPVSERSRQRVAAERDWHAFAEKTGVPVAIIRLAGIYGPGRGPFEKIRRGTARRIVKPGQVFNRIHAEDIAAIVEAAFLQRAAGPFNGADDEPAPPQDVLGFAAELLGVPSPPEVAFEAAELTPMARSFYGENKRVKNDRIKRELGVRLANPTYREGLRAVLAAEAQKA